MLCMGLLCHHITVLLIFESRRSCCMSCSARRYTCNACKETRKARHHQHWHELHRVVWLWVVCRSWQAQSAVFRFRYLMLDAPELGSQLLFANFQVSVLQTLGLSAHYQFESMAHGMSENISVTHKVLVGTASYGEVSPTAIAFEVSSRLKFRLFMVSFVLLTSKIILRIWISAARTNVSMHVRVCLFAPSAGMIL